MGLRTKTDVDEVEAVQDRNGDYRPAADADKQTATNDRLGNFANIRDGDQTDDTTGTALPAGAVPEGVTVVVQAKPGNAAAVSVGGSTPTVSLEPGQHYEVRVTDTSAVTIVASSTGDGVNFSHEATA